MGMTYIFIHSNWCRIVLFRNLPFRLLLQISFVKRHLNTQQKNQDFRIHIWFSYNTVQILYRIATSHRASHRNFSSRFLRWFHFLGYNHHHHHHLVMFLLDQTLMTVCHSWCLILIILLRFYELIFTNNCLHTFRRVTQTSCETPYSKGHQHSGDSIFYLPTFWNNLWCFST